MLHLPLALADGPRWIDLLGLALVGLFLILGAVRGLWWQLLRLLGLAAAVSVARALAPRLSPGLAEALPGLDQRLASGVVWVAVIALGLAVLAIVGRLGKESIEAAQLGPVDRAGGALAGALSGALIHGALVLCLVLLAPSPWSHEAISGTRTQRLLDALGRRIPLLFDAHAAEALAAPAPASEPASGK